MTDMPEGLLALDEWVGELLNSYDWMGTGDSRSAAIEERHQRERWASIRAALEQEVERLRGDARRLDWLVKMHVEVRAPLVYGSRALFHASPPDEEDPDEPSDLRERVDAAMQATQ